VAEGSLKYFFLTDGWTIGRVWASDGLRNETAWRRQPDIQRMNLCLVEESEKLWLYSGRRSFNRGGKTDRITKQPQLLASGQVVLRLTLLLSR